MTRAHNEPENLRTNSSLVRITPAEPDPSAVPRKKGRNYWKLLTTSKYDTGVRRKLHEYFQEQDFQATKGPYINQIQEKHFSVFNL